MRFIALGLCCVSTGFADGFQLKWAIEHEPHVVLRLTSEQIQPDAPLH
jgi:hypothetical protein